MSINGKLREMYLDYVNNYLSVECFAYRNNIELDDAHAIIKMGRLYHENYCADGFEIASSDK